jgi:hypothetical protein
LNDIEEIENNPSNMTKKEGNNHHSYKRKRGEILIDIEDKGDFKFLPPPTIIRKKNDD